MRDVTAPQAGVLFDFDGVLVDSEALWYRAYSIVLADFGVSVTPEVYAREWVTAGLGPEYAIRTFGLQTTPEELRRRRGPIVASLVRDVGVLLPGVADALARLSARYPLAVATNSTAPIVEPFLEKHAIRDRFRAVLTKEKYSRAKPAPDAYLAAAAAIGLPPSRCVVIEDSERGAVAAHLAGARCVAIPNWWTEESDFSTSDRILASAAELTPELVETILAEPLLTVRAATDADRAGIHAAHVGAIRELASRRYAPQDVAAWLEGKTPDAYPIATSRFVVAEDADGVAGFGEIALPDREVRAVYVHPRRAGRGVGARILSALERIGREAGVTEAELSSSLNAVAFYERRGWKRVADERHRLDGGGEIACVRMRKRLLRGADPAAAR